MWAPCLPTGLFLAGYRFVLGPSSLIRSPFGGTFLCVWVTGTSTAVTYRRDFGLRFWTCALLFGKEGSVDGFYRQKTGRVLKNIKIRDRNSVVIDLLFLFLFALVLCVVIRTNVVFLVKKTTWSLVGPTKTVWRSILFCLFGGG